jgi:hypothetical protein
MGKLKCYLLLIVSSKTREARNSKGGRGICRFTFILKKLKGFKLVLLGDVNKIFDPGYIHNTS